MSRLNDLIQLFRTTIKDWRLTAEALKQIPPRVHGVHFANEATFPLQNATDAPGSAIENPLLSYFEAHKDGPGIWKWRHYFDIYERHFRKFVGREVHVLEVGIYSGGSLPMWRNYFGPGCRVYGVDIEEACRAYKDDTTKVFIGDQADRNFWAQIRNAVPTVDILIDDGGHQPEQQRITLEEMLPHLRPGGIYLCEDIHGATNPFAAYLHGLASRLHSMTPSAVPDGIPGIASAASEFQKAIRGIYLYPFVAVIEKREQDLAQLVAPKHGTQWQPFL